MPKEKNLRTATAKVGVVLIGVIVVLMCGIGLSFLSFTLGYLVASALTIALVIFTSRRFRGQNESDQPREWWKMTAAPLSGFVVGALFLIQGVSIAVSAGTIGGPGVVWAGVIVSLVIAIGYIHSACRLSRRGITSRA